MSQLNKIAARNKKRESKLANLVRYTKLVVPTRMRSVYWKYFGFPASEDGTLITREKIVCMMCKNQIIYNRNTSNLRMHLHSKHRQVLHSIDADVGYEKLPRKRSVENDSYVLSEDVNDTVDISASIDNIKTRDCSITGSDVQLLLNQSNDMESEDPNIAVIFPNGDEMHEYNIVTGNGNNQDFMDVIADFIITDLHLPSIVEEKGFQKLTSILRPNNDLPNKQRFIDETLTKIYNSYRYAILDSISNNVGSISLSIEEWEDTTSAMHMSFFIHYQQCGDSNLLTRMLSCIRCTGYETVNDWSEMIDKLFIDWNIDPCCVRAIVGSFANKELMLCFKKRDFIVIPCLLFVLQNACQEICFGNNAIAPVLNKCRAIVDVILQNNSKDIIEITDEEFLNDVEDGLFIHDYPEVWISTYHMLKGILVRRITISSYLCDYSIKFGENLILDDSEWDIIQDVVQVLEPLKVIVITLSEEKSTLVSLLRPVIWQVTNAHFSKNDDDSSLVQYLKATMQESVINQYNSENVNNFLQVATALDPRFKSFLYDNEQLNMEPVISELLIKLLEVEGTRYPEPHDVITKVEKKQNRHSGINIILGNLCSSKSPIPCEERARLELIQYQSECSATLEDCPLQWWNHMSNKAPNLLRLAQKYHCIPAIAIPSEHIGINNRINYIIKRGSLNAEVVDMMLFLHANHSMFNSEY